MHYLNCPPDEDQNWEFSFSVTIHVHRAKEQRREIDDVPKKLYRCGAAYGLGIDWVSWVAADLGLCGPEEALPVLIDGGHALRNFRGRVTVADDDELVEDSIWASMRSPKVTCIEGREEFLVEYRLGEDHELGYFVFIPLDDRRSWH